MSTRDGDNRNKCRKVIAFLRRCPIAPDQQDKRWREQSLRGKLDITYSCARHGVCREFTPVFAKHLRSFWLIDSLAIGVDRMKRNFGPMQEKGRKGGALERRELTVVITAEVDCFRSADQPGTTPFVDIGASFNRDPKIHLLSGDPVIRQRWKTGSTSPAWLRCPKGGETIFWR